MDQQNDAAWPLIRAAADAAADFEPGDRVADLTNGSLEWNPLSGWRSLLPADDPRQSALDLYLPICSATATRPIAVGHLGQSLDAFIATHSGDSQFVTGSANIIHLHRMRALCDAVIVGSGTVAAVRRGDCRLGNGGGR
jgi:diaminohydroxyphosphoribosylaminopyrimidine deaminase / 5-amino-6-(5-phosphoribosylamino)uracil reductase